MSTSWCSSPSYPMAEMAAARYRKSNYSKKSSSSIRSSASARQTPPASPSASPRKGRPHPRDISSVAKSPSKSPGKSGSAAVIPNDHVKVAAASRRSDSPDSTRGAKLSCLAECLPVHVPERDSAGRSLALPGEEEEAEVGEGHGAGMAKVMSFLVKLKKLPMEHLTQYMSDKQNRNKIWRTIESSRNQKKVARKGIAMGIGVGVEYDRILELHGKGITYTHEDGTLPKTISFHDVRYVGAVGGGRSSRWKIVMKDEKQPCYEFAADTVKARDVRAPFRSARNVPSVAPTPPPLAGLRRGCGACATICTPSRERTTWTTCSPARTPRRSTTPSACRTPPSRMIFARWRPWAS